MVQRRGVLAAGAALSVSVLVPGRSLAQPFPSKPIRIVVPFAPGGATDVLARALAQQLSVQTGATVIVDNRPGASGAVAMELVARAPADGYTLLWGSDTVVVQPLLRKNFPVDTMRDFTPLARLGTAPIVLSVSKKLPARDIKELIALAKAGPGTLRYASAGNGSTQHLAGEEFKIRTGTDLIHVPYKGTGPAVIDALGGHIDVVYTGVGEIASHAASGELRPLAVMAESRVAALPALPTMAESGFPNFIAGSWMGVLGPANLPKDVVTWLSDQVVAAALSEEFKQKSLGFGITGALLKGPETGAFMRSLSERFREAIEKARITPDS
jgi:tripartite-type tricarboxylate transporter receptor subunit TctC